MRVTCQRVADAHRLWGATSSLTKFNLSSCHASSFCNNLASLALQLMEREPIIQHFGVWVEIQLEAQHPQLRYLAPSQIWGLRSLSLLLEGGWALGQCRQLYLHLLINSANLFRADKSSSESGSCSMVLLWQLSDLRCILENAKRLFQVASGKLHICKKMPHVVVLFVLFLYSFFGCRLANSKKMPHVWFALSGLSTRGGRTSMTCQVSDWLKQLLTLKDFTYVKYTSFSKCWKLRSQIYLFHIE